MPFFGRLSGLADPRSRAATNGNDKERLSLRSVIYAAAVTDERLRVSRCREATTTPFLNYWPDWTSRSIARRLLWPTVHTPALLGSRDLLQVDVAIQQAVPLVAIRIL